MFFLLTLLLILPQPGYCASTLVLPSRTVVIKLPYENATIPCRYTLPDKVTTTIWTRGGVTGDVVLKNSSAGIVEPGHDYEGLVSFGEECSLVFKSPRLTDASDYTITIHNDGDWSETVRVVVVEGNVIVYSSVSEAVSIQHRLNPVIVGTNDTAVTLPCDFTTASCETPQITWYYENEEKRREIMRYDTNNRMSSHGQFANRVARGDRGALVLLGPRSEDAGNYSCEVELDTDKPSRAKTTVLLDVIGESPTPEVTKDVEAGKGGMLFLIAVFWIVPMVCSFLLGRKGFSVCNEKFDDLRKKTARQLFSLGSKPVVVTLASCLICTGTVYASAGLSSGPQNARRISAALLSGAASPGRLAEDTQQASSPSHIILTPGRPRYYRVIGLTTGIFGILILLVPVLEVYLLPRLRGVKKSSTKESNGVDVMESGQGQTEQSALSELFQDAEADISTSNKGSSRSEISNCPGDAEPLMPKEPLTREKEEPELTIIENPSSMPVTGMAEIYQQEVYVTTANAVFAMDVSKGIVQDRYKKICDWKEDIHMLAKCKTDLLILSRKVMSKKLKPHLLRMALSEQKFYKIDLDSTSTMTWVLTSPDDETLILTTSNPAAVVKRTIDKKHSMKFGEGLLKNPKCVVQNSTGRFIIADSQIHDLIVFEENGDFFTSMKISVPKNVEHELTGCDKLAIGPDDRIYVSSPKSTNILVFSSDFRFQRLLPTRTEGGGTVSSLLVHNDSLYVAHEDCIRVHPLSSGFSNE